MSKVRYEAQEKRYRQKKKHRLFFFPEESLDRGSFDRSSVIAAENGAHRKKTYKRRFDERNTAYASPLLNFDAARAVSNHWEKVNFVRRSI